MADIIELTAKTRPTLIKQRRQDVRDESAAGNAFVNLTGFTVKLIVKQDRTLDDSRAYFDLAATLPDPTNGKYQFAFTLAHTALAPGDYPGTIRFWSGATTNPPDDAIDVVFRILENAENVI